MAGYSALCEKLYVLLRNGFLIAAVAAGIGLLTGVAAPAQAANDKPSAADQKCLGCHGFAGMTKKLEDGDKLDLHIPGAEFEKSVHRVVGCTGCHSNIDIAKHPPADNKIKSARSFAITTTQLCRNCHADKFTQWQSSIHAALVRSGNPAAPICTDCHNPHAVIKGAAATYRPDPLQEVPYRDLHGLSRQRARAIAAAFQGQLRAALLGLPQRP